MPLPRIHFKIPVKHGWPRGSGVSIRDSGLVFVVRLLTSAATQVWFESASSRRRLRRFGLSPPPYVGGYADLVVRVGEIRSQCLTKQMVERQRGPKGLRQAVFAMEASAASTQTAWSCG